MIKKLLQIGWLLTLSAILSFASGCSLNSSESSQAKKSPIYVVDVNGVRIDGTKPVAGSFSVKTDSVKIDGKSVTRFRLQSETFWSFIGSNRILIFAGMVSIFAALVALFLFKSKGTAGSLALIGAGSCVIAPLLSIAETIAFYLTLGIFLAVIVAFALILYRLWKAKKLTWAGFKALLSKEVTNLRDYLDDGKKNGSVTASATTTSNS